LVPDLRSYRSNRVSINPLDLPIGATISASAMDVVPARRSGVAVDFGGQPKAAALVVLQDQTGAFLPPGAVVSLRGTGSSFVLGYDGEVWIDGLEAQNRISAQTKGKTCNAEFTYAVQPGAQVYIEGIICK
jgi:outer membrane usher protein